jgi:hypothetical protein
MYKKSPNKFIGAAAISAATAGRMSSQLNVSDQLQQGVDTFGESGLIANSIRIAQAAKAKQAAQSMGVNDQVNIGNSSMIKQNPVMPGGPTDNSNPFGGQKFQITPVQMTYETPSPANMQGNAIPLFNESVTNAGNMMFGDVGQRQRSLTNQAGDIQATPYVKDPSALQGNAFGLAMEQAGGDYDKAKEIIKNK